MIRHSNRPKWAKPLNASEWRHLCESSATGRPTLGGLKRNREHQRQFEGGEHVDVRGCYDCRHIAIKLGIE